MNGKSSYLTQDKLNLIVCIHDTFEMIVEAAANGTDDDGSLKVMDTATTPATITPSSVAARRTAAMAGPSWER